MRKFLTLLTVAAVTTMLGTGVASATVHRASRPFNSRGFATLTILDSTGDQAVLDYTVSSTLIGRGMAHQDLVQQNLTLYWGTTTVVAANGDKLFGEGYFDTASSTSVTTWTGGTGRFAGTGGSTTMRHRPLVRTYDPRTFPRTFRFSYVSTGTLSLERGCWRHREAA